MMSCVWYALPTLLLYAFFMNFRPNGPFFTEYLLQCNLTKPQLYNEIFPVWSYTQFPFLFLVMVFTDVLKFRPVIWVGVLGYFLNCVLLLSARGGSVALMMVMEGSNALGSACEIAHKSYLYTIIPKDRYSRGIFYLSSVELLGKALSNLLAQVLVDQGVEYSLLNVISTVTVGLAIIWGFLLPPAWFYLKERKAPVSEVDDEEHEADDEEHEGDPLVINDSENNSAANNSTFLTFVRNLKSSYSSRMVRIWSFWNVAIVSTCFMVGTTQQALWNELKKTTDKDLNGYAYAINFFVTSLCSYILSRFSDKIEGIKWWWITFIVLLLALLCSLSPMIGNLYVAYVMDTLFQTVAVCTMCVCGLNIATNLRTKMFGFVAGVNTCAGALLDTLVNFVVVDESCLGYGPIAQFYVYSGWLVFCAGVLLIWNAWSKRY